MCGGLRIPFWNNRAKKEPVIDPNYVPGPAPEMEPKTGEDVVYIFIDTKSGSGYRGYLPITADYLIEIKGRLNNVISRTHYEWTGSRSYEWAWTQRGTVEVGLDSTKMEVGID